MKQSLIVWGFILIALTSGCQKAQSNSQVVCPRIKDLPTHTIRYPIGESPNGVYPVIVATVPHRMNKEEFIQWLDAHKPSHFIVALPPKDVEPVAEHRVKSLLTHLSCRYAIDISKVERQ